MRAREMGQCEIYVFDGFSEEVQGYVRDRSLLLSAIKIAVCGTENHSLPFGQTTSVRGSAAVGAGGFVWGYLYGQPAETTCKKHGNWYSGHGSDSFPHSPYRIHIPFCCHGAGPGESFLDDRDEPVHFQKPQ